MPLSELDFFMSIFLGSYVQTLLAVDPTINISNNS